MTKIKPAPPPKKGDDIKAKVERWHEVKEEIKALQETEMNLRKFIFAQAFPKPKEGMNRVIRAGMEIAAKHVVYRKVDKVAFATMAPELRKKGLNLDALIEMEPRLIMDGYRALDDRKRKMFEAVLTITDGAPTLDVNLGK